MKNRLIVAAIGIPALLAVIFFTPIWGWGIVVAVMASFCAWELLHTAMPKFVPRFAVYAGVCGAAIVLGAAFGLSELVFKIAAYALFVTMFVEMMISFHKAERVPFQDLALVFTAGIGENGPELRESVMKDMEWMGAKLDVEKNKVRGKEAVISTDDSKVTICVIPTNEEIMIARDTKELVEGANK